MIGTVFAAQVALPLILLAWLALRPARNRLGLVLQSAGVAAFLLALALVAQWAVLPWWLPRVYGGLWLAATLLHLRPAFIKGLPQLPSAGSGWADLTLATVLLGVGTWFAGAALTGTSPPSVPMIDVANPFGEGRYLVGSGGSREIVNAHLRTLDMTVERYRDWRGQSYAIDFFGLNRWGTRASGLQPPEPEDYAIFGAKLYAPCPGEVLALEDDSTDFEVPEQDTINRLGNHVLLQCGEVVIVMAHLRRHSIQVRTGQRVGEGMLIAEVGNSGASTEPHLHIHAQAPAAAGAPPLSAEPYALSIEGRFLVRNDRLDGKPH